MPESSFHIMIIGGGLGGLCLAQGLKKTGISVAVYERDRTPTDRLQGYRIHIEPMGNRALHACLPPHLFEMYVSTSGSAGNGHRIVTEQLREICFFAADPAHTGSDLASLDLSVSRITLRQVLLSELDDIVHFDRTFTHYQEQPGGKITAWFEDGTSATGDVLVAADGGNSRVRKQFLPQAERVETGVEAIMGKLAWTEETSRTLFIPGRFDGATTILGQKGCGMFVALHDFSHRAAEQAVDALDSQESAMHQHPGLLFDNTSSYLFWAFVARRENYPFRQDPEQLDGHALQQIVEGMIQQWHPHVQRLVRESDPSTVTLKPLHMSRPIKHWETGRITPVGDAIHSMPPTRGIGGNTALRDASLLCEQLITARDGSKSLLQAIHDYEREMVKYGFAAVRASVQMQNTIVMENVIGRLTSHALLKMMGAIFSLQRS